MLNELKVTRTGGYEKEDAVQWKGLCRKVKQNLQHSSKNWLNDLETLKGKLNVLKQSEVNADKIVLVTATKGTD